MKLKAIPSEVLRISKLGRGLDEPREGGVRMKRKEETFSMAEFYDILDSIREGVEEGYYSGGFDPTVDEEVDPELFKLFREYASSAGRSVNVLIYTPT